MKGTGMTAKLHNASRTKRDTASVTTMTFTTHVVSVDLEKLLGEIDVADGQVVLEIRTPSGRSKRVQIPSNLLVPPHRLDDWN
jgi:hypothetical protein